MLSESAMAASRAVEEAREVRVRLIMQSALEMMSRAGPDADANPWRDQAACQAATAELFFPVGRTGDAIEQIEAAKAVCRSCPVRAACLRFALETNQEAGIWGGTSEEERDRIRRAWLARRRRERDRERVSA